MCSWDPLRLAATTHVCHMFLLLAARWCSSSLYLILTDLTDFLSSPAVQLRLKHGEPWSTGMNGNTNDVSHGYNRRLDTCHPYINIYQHNIFILSYRMCIPSLVKIQWIRLWHHQNAPVKLSWVNLGSMCSHGAMVTKGLLRWKNVLKPELCKALRGEAISMLQEASGVGFLWTLLGLGETMARCTDAGWYEHLWDDAIHSILHVSCFVVDTVNLTRKDCGGAIFGL